MAISLTLDKVSHVLPDGSTLFENIDFQLTEHRTAIVGRNGVGKSVLARILAGQIKPSSGKLVGNVQLTYLAQQWTEYSYVPVASVLGLQPALAAMHRIELGNASDEDFSLAEPWWDWRQQLDQHLPDVGLNPGLDIQRPFGTFSGGEQMRLWWLSALLQQPDAFLFDEPSNHLDTQGRNDFVNWLEHISKPVILITHDRQLLDRVDAIHELTPFYLHHHPGNYEQYLDQQKKRWQQKEHSVSEARKQQRLTRTRQQQTFEKQQQRAARGRRHAETRGLSKLEVEFARENAGKHQHHQAMVKANRQQVAMDNLSTAELHREWFEPIDINLAKSQLPSSRTVLVCTDLVSGISNPLHKPLNLHIRGPARIHLQGRNGSGKTILLKTIQRLLKPVSGSAKISVPWAYMSQDWNELPLTKSPVELLCQLHTEITRQQAFDQLASLRLRNHKATLPMSELSGGEQLKTVLAMKLLGPVTPKLLLLDEPTNHLDLDSRAALEQALSNFRGALIVVSHDQNFVEQLGIDKILKIPECEVQDSTRL